MEKKLLDQVRRCDYFRLKRKYSLEDCEKSIAEKARRQSYRFNYHYDPHLPIFSKREDIINAIKNNQVLILAGETGSGKTTQIPKFCLEAGRGVQGKIACTQPRRIAALSVSERIAEELQDPLAVGVKIRFHDKDHEKSFIKIMTDGVLLAETQSDRWLNQYDTIIIDEAHERSLNIDFILGFLKRLLTKRRDLKVIITSATIDTEKFSKAFGEAPIIQVSGRTFPVEIRYRPGDEEDSTLAEQAWNALEEILTESSRGDILVFMPTEQDIKEAIEIGPKRLGRSQAILLPLYARLPSQDQKRIFHSAESRKIIFSTNIAETSLTIPGIRFVVDSGLARLARYSPGSGTFGLPVEPVSRSSADQRKGRCGRVEEGICIRLYDEEDYQGRSLYTQPEVLRTNLAEVILRMIYLGIEDVTGFPFIDPPSTAGFQDGYKTLIELKAIQSRGKGKHKSYDLTQTGRAMAKIPADPRLSRMLLQSKEEGCIKEALILMGALSIQDPREKPKDKPGKALEKQAEFVDKRSDFMTLLNIWKGWEKTSGSLMKRIKAFSKEYFLSFKRMKEWVDLYQQFLQIAKEQKLNVQPFQGTDDALYNAVHKSILSGFLSHCSHKKDKYAYEATRKRDAYIYPGSALFKNGGTWLVSGEMVRTSKLYLRINAQIDPLWFLDIGAHLLTYRYLEPHWKEETGEVQARQEIRIFGFLLSNDNWVPYGPVDPSAAREIFIRQALMEGLRNNAPAFLQKNRNLKKDVLKVENKLRTRGLINEEVEEQRYFEILPNVSSLSELLLWIKKEGDEKLYLRKEDFLPEVPGDNLLKNLPDYMHQGKQSFKIQYRFNPGDSLDGPTLLVPQNRIEQWNPDELPQNLPGLLKEQVTAYLKGLPKQQRRQLIPLGEHVDCILKEWDYSEDTTIESALSRFLYEKWKMDVPASLFDPEQLPPHIKLKYAITGKKGQIVKSSSNPLELKEKKNLNLDQATLDQWNRQEKKLIRSLDQLKLQRSETRKWKGKEITLYPSLRKQKDSIETIMFLDAKEADESLKNAVAGLVGIYYQKEIKNFKKECSLQRFNPLIMHFKHSNQWVDRLWDNVLIDLFGVPLRDSDKLHQLIIQKGSELYSLGMKWFLIFQEGLEQYVLWREYLKSIGTSGVKHLQDYVEQRSLEGEKLFENDFPLGLSKEDLKDIPRSLRCLQARTVKGLLDLPQDRERQHEWDSYHKRIVLLQEQLSPYASNEKKQALSELLLGLKEYKFALFCQQEKRKIKISPKRLEEMIIDFNRMS